MQVGKIISFFSSVTIDFYVVVTYTFQHFYSGGKRKLHIPPHLAYGPEPAGCFSGENPICQTCLILIFVQGVSVCQTAHRNQSSVSTAMGIQMRHPAISSIPLVGNTWRILDAFMEQRIVFFFFFVAIILILTYLRSWHRGL